MIAAPFAVLLMGLRHGADPDHLAAIDNLTRSAHERMPRSSRFVGTLFAVGHSAMVIGTAAVAGLIGSRIGAMSEGFERLGALASIAALLLMAALNIVTLVRGGATPRAAFVPRALREATHPLFAIPLGALFGLGFETSSQLLAYGAAFSTAHLVDGIIVGIAFCCGMIATDTVDSLFVARVVGARGARALGSRRVWIGVVTCVALAVAAEETAQFAGLAVPFDEATLSAATVVLLVLTTIVLAVRSRFAKPAVTSLEVSQ